MTPQESAQNLVEKFYNVEDTEWTVDNGCGISWNEAKQCALIAVDEMLPICSTIKIVYSNTTIHPKLNYTELTHYTEDFYWKQVRNEIEKL
jgi:hypothetical protein